MPSTASVATRPAKLAQPVFPVTSDREVAETGWDGTGGIVRFAGGWAGLGDTGQPYGGARDWTVRPPVD
ncbi:hypothetical protein GCM10023198_06160 [Promicromonospora umidemergens]|uniref:Uncharacterized protein n=1 Tax=Promicromonospora umidemergens TaxID=629679 RepID=A0ABP8WHY1_9MICO